MGIGNFKEWVQRGEAGRVAAPGNHDLCLLRPGSPGSCKVRKFEKRQIGFAPLALVAGQGKKRQRAFLTRPFHCSLDAG